MTEPSINTTMKKALRSAIYLVFLLAAVVMFTLGPKIEALINPVVGAFKVERIWQEQKEGEPKRYYASGALLKLRGECEPTEIIMEAGGGFSDKNSKYVNIDFSPDPIQRGVGLRTRPEGSQYWGPWRFYPPQEPIGPIVRLVVRHKCHSLWQQSQTIYTGLTSDLFPGIILDTKTGD